MSVRVKYKGVTYAFSKDAKDRGHWYATHGRNANVTVPIIVSQELRRQALKDGVDPKAFASPKREKEKSIRVRSKRASNPNKNKGSFSISISSLMKTMKKYQEEDKSTE